MEGQTLYRIIQSLYVLTHITTGAFSSCDRQLLGWDRYGLV
jgi:hypothetical protein